MDPAREGFAFGAAGRYASRFLRDPQQTRHCDAPNCRRATREGKPYCSDHVDKHPYVADLLKRIEAVENEEARLNDGARPNAFGLVARDLLIRLMDEGGAATVDRMARFVALDGAALMGLVASLAAAGRVRVFRTKRGSVAMRLVVRRRAKRIK